MKKRIIIAGGGTGFVGQTLRSYLIDQGYDEVVVLTRDPDRHPKENGVRFVRWDGRTVGDWKSEIDGAHAVVNLAGKNVNCRYTKAALDEIDQSRVNAVTAMDEAIAQCAAPPKVLVQSGSLAIYGDAGDGWCDEARPAGEGIPPQTCLQWETAFQDGAAQTPLTRRVMFRISFVLGIGGGAVRMLATLTRCFLGGASGNGQQFISWIHHRDFDRMIVWAIENEAVSGIYNATSPNPARNREFMQTLRKVLRRPWSPPVPQLFVRLGCIFMRTESVLALTGRRGSPKKIEAAGFTFEFPELEPALRDVFVEEE